LLVDPTDTEAIAHALYRLMTEPELRQALRAQGPVQAQRFSWQAAARKLLGRIAP
jgi:glycosyltransferase involved in cell wall biosynthesis